MGGQGLNPLSLGQSETQGAINVTDLATIPEYSADGDAPNATLYYNTSDTLFKYKDSSGTVRDASAIVDSVFGATGAVTESDASFFDGTNLTADVDNSAVTTDDTDTKRVAGHYHYAAEYDGADPDARLGNALSAASAGDRIFLESGTYDSARTFSSDYVIVGPGFDSGPLLQATWTLDANIVIKNIKVDSGNGGKLDLDTANCVATYIRGPGAGEHITVGGNNCLVTHSVGVVVTLESGTSGIVVDDCTASSITDNGTNTVGNTS